MIENEVENIIIFFFWDADDMVAGLATLQLLQKVRGIHILFLRKKY